MNAENDFMVDHDFGQSHTGVNPLKMVLTALRGRWHWAILLGGILGAAMAAGGYWYGKRDIAYMSQGIVRIVPSRPQILYETELNQRLPEYDSYRALQARLLESQRVLNWAIESDEMRQIGWPESNAGLRQLIQALRVSVPRNEDVILVRVTHEDPTVAQSAVNAVLRAYERLSTDAAAQEFKTMEAELQTLRDTYRIQQEDSRDAMLQLAEQFGTDNLERRREAKGVELDRLERRILETEVALTTLPALSEEENEPNASVRAADLEIEALAQYDPQLASLISRLQSIEIDLASNEDQLGPEHPQMLRLQRDADAIRILAERRANAVRERLGPGELSATTTAEGPQTRQKLEQQLSQLMVLREKLAAQVLELGRTQLRIDVEKQRAEEAGEAFAETNRRLEALRVEQGDRRVGRVEITQFGERPLRPTGDKKNKLAAMGGAAGMGFGFVLVALPGLLAPKYKSIGQITAPSSLYSVLGVMPELDAGGAAGDELARLNLHQIRVLLEAARSRAGSQSEAYLFTSATAGEGKTSLALSLSSAYANAGLSVVMLDADLVGRALTHQLASPELDGVLQWLRRRDLTAEPPIHSTVLPGVYLVPHGRDNGIEAEGLGPTHIRAMIDKLKERFDIVLVDSGPILGSTEAAAAASICDETVLVIGRGQRESLVKAARDRLERLGARRVGLVFNRADREDLERFPSSATSASVSKRSRVSTNAPRTLALSLAMQADSDPRD